MFDERTIILSIKANSPNGNAFDCQSLFDTVLCAHMKNGHENALTRSPSLLHGYFAAALFNSINLRHPQTNEACSGKGAAAAAAKTTPREKRTTLEKPTEKGKGQCARICLR